MAPPSLRLPPQYPSELLRLCYTFCIQRTVFDSFIWVHKRQREILKAAALKHWPLEKGVH